MVGFYDLSDTDNDSAVEEIISQAQDAVVLDQVSAINCSAFTDDSLLPSHLETRFRNLKSFPPTKPKPNTIAKARTFSSNLSSANPQSPNFSPPKQNPDSGYTSSHEKKSFREKTKDGSLSVSASSPPSASASASSPCSDESSMSSLFKPKQKEEGSKQNSSVRSSNSPSPPRRRGCLWFFPKKKKEEEKEKKKKKKSKQNWGDDLLSELGSFSRKEQQKMLKKAMKEEEKVSREAEKIVQWAKQASARFNLEDELSD
ncbi:hypothetical protein JHK87_001850 [Glycine soja]|nr:hypothetical protein JHK87_001850 [Glycine soja]